MTQFFVGQRVLYRPDRHSQFGVTAEGIVATVNYSNNTILVKNLPGYGDREFRLNGRGFKHPNPSSIITPITVGPVKRQGYVLLSTHAGKLRFFLDLQEASDELRASDGSYVLCGCEQQADSEGGEFRTVNVGGPVEPLPAKPKKTYAWLRVKAGLGPRDWSYMSDQETPRPGFTGNLKLTFEGETLVSAEVVS